MIEATNKQLTKRFPSADDAAEALDMPIAMIQAALGTGKAIDGWTLTTVTISGHALTETLATLNNLADTLRELIRASTSRNSRRLKPIQAFDVSTGEIRYTYDYIEHSKTDGFSPHSVRKAIETRRAYEGFGWRWACDESPDLQRYQQPEPEPEPEQGNALERFFTERVFNAPGHMIPFAEFYESFLSWLPLADRKAWSRIRVSKSLPADHPSGAHHANKTYVINAAWEPKPAAKPYSVGRGGRISRS